MLHLPGSSCCPTPLHFSAKTKTCRLSTTKLFRHNGNVYAAILKLLASLGLSAYHQATSMHFSCYSYSIILGAIQPAGSRESPRRGRTRNGELNSKGHKAQKVETGNSARRIYQPRAVTIHLQGKSIRQLQIGQNLISSHNKLGSPNKHNI